MGQKVHPGIFRKKFNARWYAEGPAYAETLYSDVRIRELVYKTLPESSSISLVFIERSGRNVKVSLRTSKPGVIIGKKGEEIEKLKTLLKQVVNPNATVAINIEEVRKPEADAKLVAENIAQQLVKRIAFRRAMKRAVSGALRQGAKGIKICVSGRLGGADIARKEWCREGRVPLHTLRADIDYATAIARTTYGIIGVKVWIFKGEHLDKAEEPSLSENRFANQDVGA
jgi:small subunit ribosomal protein S3